MDDFDDNMWGKCVNASKMEEHGAKRSREKRSRSKVKHAALHDLGGGFGNGSLHPRGRILKTQNEKMK